MPISEFTSQVSNQYVQITTVDSRNRTIHGRLKDGANIAIAVYNTPPFFRWPRENEIWSVAYKGVAWTLCEYIESVDPQSPIEDLMPGEARIDADRLVVPGDLDVSGYLKVDGVSVVLDNDPRLTNARAPLPHIHAMNDVTGLGTALNGKLDTSHELDATNVHGIADTSQLVLTTDIRLSDARTPVAHVHAIADVTGLQTALDGRVLLTDPRLTDARTPTAHTHPISDVTNLSTTLTAKADLVGGLVPTSQIPAIATNQTVTVASQAAMLALTAAQVQPGDIAIRTDQAGRRWLLAADDPSQLGNWIQLEVPDTVQSVNGQQGTVVLGYADVGAAPTVHAHTISDVTGLQTALNAKAPLASPAFTGDGSIAGDWTISGGDLILGGDVNLYRSAADTLATDDSFYILGDRVLRNFTSGNGYSAITRTMAGVELGAVGMNTTSQFTTALKFMSTDTALTTESPKLLAYVVGRAMQSYLSDDDGGMALDFGVTVNNPGATNVPTVGMSLLSTGLVLGPTTATTTTARLHLPATAGAAEGIQWGTDANAVNLYRSANDTLKTDDNFEALSYSVGTTPLASTHLSDSATLARLASPAFTGTPTAPTAAVNTNTTQLATTAFVIGQAYAKLASPALTGTPTAPTAAVDTNTTQLATTAYVVSQGYLKSATAASTYVPLTDARLTDSRSPSGVAGGDLSQNYPNPAVRGELDATGGEPWSLNGLRLTADYYMPQAGEGQRWRRRYIRNLTSDINPRRLGLFSVVRDVVNWQSTGPVELTIRTVGIGGGGFVRCLVRGAYNTDSGHIEVLETGGQHPMVPLITLNNVSSGNLREDFVYLDLPQYTRVIVEVMYNHAEITGAATAGGQIRFIADEAGSTGTGGSVYSDVWTALPTTNLYDGRVINFQTSAMATLGIAWQLRYRADGGTYKWEYIGGGLWTSTVATSETYAGDSTWRDAATVGPTITIPLAGEYEVYVQSNQYSSTHPTNLQMGVVVGAATPEGLDYASASPAATGFATTLSINTIMTLAAAAALRVRYSSSAGTTTVRYRRLSIRPLHVG